MLKNFMGLILDFQSGMPEFSAEMLLDDFRAYFGR
jgi:hypothetical protein